MYAPQNCVHATLGLGMEIWLEKIEVASIDKLDAHAPPYSLPVTFEFGKYTALYKINGAF